MDNNALIHEWFHKAEMDIATALFMQKYRPIPVEIICYHCQQAGEKILKGILAASNSEIPRTHRLEIVLDLVSPFEPSLVKLTDDCFELSPYATISRYPSSIDLNEQDMGIALNALGNIINAIQDCGYIIQHDELANDN